MIPVMNRRGTYQLKIPELSGGLNLRDGVSLVNDNQLTDVKNMWYKDGILRTRPMLRENESYTIQPRTENGTMSTNPMNNTRINDKVYYLEIIKGTDLVSSVERILLKYVSVDDEIDLGHIDVETKSSVLAITHNGNVYVYTHGENTNEIYIVEWVSEGVYNAPRKVAETEIYTPLVLTNIWSCYNVGGDAQSLIRNGATKIEGFNLLGNRYKMQGSLYDASENGNIEVTDQDGNVIDTVSYMEYGLPFTPHNLSYNALIYLTYTDVKGIEHKHSVQCPRTEIIAPCIETSNSQASAGDDYWLHSFIANGIIHISINTSNDINNYTPDTIKRAEYVNNNMIIDAPCENPQINWEKVTGMTQAVWYGNTSLGINGGSRLFLGGNVKDQEQALVVWSDFENPLYFSENNYAYVGDKSQRVTAFGRQGASLIVFKENEIYSTQYTQSEVTAEELENQTAIDITTRMAYFPMVLIHSVIGCDCPRTVQLCRNRLVFANSSGRVYTLTGQNQYSERNVYEVSEMISNRLKTEKNLQMAHAVDWDGKYILFVNNNAYLMDYNSYGFENISSYTRQSDANMLLPWWIWELPITPQNITTLNETIILTDIKEWYDVAEGAGWFSIHKYHITGENGKDVLYRSSFNGTTLTRQKYESDVLAMIQTKIFDFNEQSAYKNITKVNVAFGNNNGVPVLVKFISEVTTTDEHIVNVNGAETTLREPAHIKNKAFIPYTRICSRFGIRVESTSGMELDGITLNYRMAGGIK